MSGEHNWIGDRFEEFQIRNMENQFARCLMTRNHFIEHIKDIGGNFYENFFALGAPEKTAITKSLFRNKKKAEKEGVDELRRNEKLLSSFSRLVYEKSRPGLKPLDTLIGFEDKEIQLMARAATPLNQKRARDLVDCWLLDENEISKIKAEDKISMIRLHSRLLLEVDRMLSPYFPNGVETLINWLIDDQQDSLEFFITGTPEAEEFRSFVGENQMKLKVSAFLDLGVRGWEESPLQIIENIGKLLFIDVKRVSRLSGRDQNGKNIAVEKKKALIDSYVKQKKFKKTLPDKQKKEILAREVIEKHNHNKNRMSVQEREYYTSIGDRIILMKRNHVPFELYWRIICSLVAHQQRKYSRLNFISCLEKPKAVHWFI